MRISEIKRQARSSLKGQWGQAVLLTFIIFLLTTVIPGAIENIITGDSSSWYDSTQTSPSAQAVSLLISIILIPVTTTVYWYYLSLVRSERPQISQVFSIFSDGKTYFKLIGMSFMIGIFVFLWSLLLIIPGIIKAISYSQTYYLLKDHPEYTVFEAITESKKRMKGYKGKYFLMNLSFIGWGILGIFTLGIGYLWLTPYISASNATFYNELIISEKDKDDLYF